MKHIYFFLCILGIFLLPITVSCEKQGDVIDMRAYVDDNIGNDAKVHLFNNYSAWDIGDQIRLNGTVYTLTDSASTYAKISGVPRNGGGYRALYPASLGSVSASQYYTVNLPQVQTYHETKIPIPMVAYASNSSNPELAFRAITALMKITVSGTLKVKSIVVSATVPLCGTGSIVVDDDNSPVLVLNDGQETSVTLDCGDGVKVLGSKDFYIIIPAIAESSNRFSIAINAVDTTGEECIYTKSQGENATGTIARSQLGVVPFEVATANRVSSGRLCGKFQFSPRKFFNFSKGNLQYDHGVWRFAENQYDYIGSDNSTNVLSNGVIDLFGWGTNDNPYNPYQISTNTADYLISGSLNEYDWGTATISNGGSYTWRTPAQAELISMLTYNSWGFSKVNNVYGVVLVPGLGHTVSLSYTEEAWQNMAMDGAVFLPGAGYRIGTNCYGVNSRGAYWTSTNIGNYLTPYYLYFKYRDENLTVTRSNIGSTTVNVSRGFSVRLVNETY